MQNILKTNPSDLNNLNNKLSNSLYLTFIYILSFFYAVLVGAGLYGYGVDYVFAYTKGFDWSSGRAGILDYLGFRISTLNIDGYFISVYVVTFILSISTGILLKTHLLYHKSYSLFFFLSIFIIAIHTWPIVMSTSNAMRQGLAMSFIFLALNFSFQKRNYLMIFFILISISMHKSSILFMLIIFFSTFMSNLNYLTNKKYLSLIYFFIGLFLFFLTNLFLNFMYPNWTPTRIIGGDYRAAFAFISCFYILLAFFNKKLIANSFNLSLYYYSFISLAPLVVGLNWQYERLGMMMIIPYILAYGFLFKTNSYQIYLAFSFLFLFLLTIFNGMFAALIPLSDFNYIFYKR